MNIYNIKARVITMTGSVMTPDQERRFDPRKKYVEQDFIPQLRSLGLDANAFPAITPQNKNLLIGDVDIQYGNMTYVRGKNRSGEDSSPNQIVLVLGHMEIWKESVATNAPILVFEDDAILRKENEELVCFYIKNFLDLVSNFDPKSILYLQSTCPWRSGKPNKVYPDSALLPSTEHFSKIVFSWEDVSGTIAYMVTPTSAKKLIEYFSNNPIWSIDGMIDDAKRSCCVNMYIPKEYTKNFKIHPVLG